MSKGGERNNEQAEKKRKCRLVALIKGILSTMDTAHRSKVTELTEFEIRELENMFLLLLMGSFTGMPSPPSFISAELLPHLEHEIQVLNERAERSSDSFAEAFGMLDID